MNYYEVGTPEDIWISNSSLSALNPEQGGHPQKFLDFFKEREEEKESKAMQLGTMLHKYIENPDAFIVSEVVKPTDMMCGLLEAFVKEIDDYKNGLSLINISESNVALTSNLKGKAAQEAELKELGLNFIVLQEKYDLRNIFTAIVLFRQARAKSNAYKSYSEARLLREVVETQIKYIDFLISSKGKIALTIQEKEKLDSMVTSIYNNSLVKTYLGLDTPDELDLPKNIKIYKEISLFWETTSTEGIVIKKKAKLDVVIVDFDNQVIKVPDAKTTGDSIYKFAKSFQNFQYDRQFGFYYDAILSNLPQIIGQNELGNWKIEMYVVPIETFGYFLSTVYRVPTYYITEGNRKVNALTQRYLFHKTSGDWSKSMEEIRFGIPTLPIPDDTIKPLV